MDSLKCEAFLAAVEQGSFTAAAQLLGYTQPGITRMIRSLEAETGFPLLVRSPRGVMPTENGKAMLPLFREIVRARQSAEELSSEIDELKEHIYGTAADKVSMEQVDEASKRAGV